MTSFRRCWNVPALHASWVVVDARDLEPGEERRVVPETFVEGSVAAWARDPSTCRALLEMYEAVVGSGRCRPPTEELVRTAVKVVQAAFHGRRLVAIEEPRVAAAQVTEPVEAKPDRGLSLPKRPPPRPGSTDWVEIVVKDQDGKPLPGIRVRLTLADRTVRDVKTSYEGIVNLTQIAPGQCQLELPDLDKDAWSKA